MKIKILGTRGEIEPSAPYHSKHSGVLVDDLLFDLGEKEFLDKDPTAIFITHLHPDHAYFIRSSKKSPKIETPIYTPETTEKADTKIIEPETTINLSQHDITPLPTHHSKKVESQAYLIESENKKILYTGDIIWLNKEYHYYLKDLDLVITEGSFLREGGLIRKDKETGQIFGHNGIPDLIRLFRDFTDNFIIIHFGSWFYKRGAKQARQKLQKIASKEKVSITAGYDGMEVKI